MPVTRFASIGRSVATMERGHEDRITVNVNMTAFEARLERIEHHLHQLLHRDDSPAGNPSVTEALQRIETNMSALSDAIAAAVTRVVNAIQAITDKLDEALGNDAADASTIAALQAEVDALKAEAASAIAELANLAPDPAEPPVEPPVI